LTLIGSVPCLSIGHAEQVVGVDAAVSATVAGNRSANHLSFLGLIHAEEIVHGLIVGLGGGFSVWYCRFSVELGSITVELLVRNNTISVIEVSAEELADSLWVDGLLHKKNKSD